VNDVRYVIVNTFYPPSGSMVG